MSHLTIVGLGPGPRDLLTREGEAALTHGKLILRTRVHPLTATLPPFESFDSLYEESADFDQVYRTIVERLLKALEQGDVTYAVPGHPMVGERTVREIIPAAKAAGHTVRVVPGVSALEALYAALAVDPSEGVLVLDAIDLDVMALQPRVPTILLQVYQQRIAADAKLTLMERYPDEHPVTIIRSAGDPAAEQQETVPLSRLDRVDWVDHLTSVYVPALSAAAIDEAEPYEDFGEPDGVSRLVDTVAYLRSPEGCPWDREQTPETLTRYILEEAYEVVTAIEAGDQAAVVDELGDLLLQVVLQSQIAKEAGRFDFDEVAWRQSDKLIRRHPHVFAEADADDSGQVLAQWEQIKANERGDASPLAGVAHALPALVRAEKLQKRAARVGFDWPTIDGIWDKLHEEEGELRQALASGEATAIRDELGDYLFAAVNLARWLKVDPEEALRLATAKFVHRFERMEAAARAQGKPLDSLSLDEWDRLWTEAKRTGSST